MENSKITYSMALTSVIDTLADGEIKDKLVALRESIDKKNSAKSGKPSAKQTENIGIKNDIVEAMEIGKSYTISDMLKEFECLEGYTNQKVSALVRQLCDAHTLVRSEVKRKAYFTLAEVDE